MNIEGIPVSIIRTPPKKTVSMKVRATQSGAIVEVRAARRVSEAFIVAFVKERREWIIKQARRIEEARMNVPRIATPPPAREVAMLFMEHYHKMLEVFGIPLQSAPRLSIRLMKSRWGSYRSGTHSIALNSALAQTPSVLLDYVIAHEISHITNLHHGPSFYTTLSAHMPDWAARRKALKAYASVLHIDTINDF